MMAVSGIGIESSPFYQAVVNQQDSNLVMTDLISLLLSLPHEGGDLKDLELVYDLVEMHFDALVQTSQWVSILQPLLNQSKQLRKAQLRLSLKLAEYFLALAKKDVSYIPVLTTAMHYYAKAICLHETNSCVKEIHHSSSHLFFLLAKHLFKEELERLIREDRNDQFKQLLLDLDRWLFFCSTANERKELLSQAQIVITSTIGTPRHNIYAPFLQHIAALLKNPFIAPALSTTERYFEALQTLRNAFLQSEQESSLSHQKRIVKQWKKFFEETLLADAFKLLGPPPCEYDIRAMGSLGKEAPGPYSDLEYMILISNASEKNVAYFTQLAQLIELQIISLGETAPTNLPIFTSLGPVHFSGLHVDFGGNPAVEPQGLIRTPQQMAGYLNEACDSPNSIQHTSLRTTSLAASTPSLFQEYQQFLQKNDPTGAKKRKWALSFLWGRIVDYQQRWSTHFENPLEICIKTQYLELLAHTLNDLALYYDRKEVNIFELLHAFSMDSLLAEPALLTNETKTLLEESFSTLYEMRFRLHLCSQRQNDRVIFNSLDPVSINDTQALEKIYWLVLFPFYLRLQEAVAEQNTFESSFHSLDLLSIGFHHFLNQHHKGADSKPFRHFLFHFVKYLAEPNHSFEQYAFPPGLPEGQSLLHLVARLGEDQAIPILLKNNFDINLRDSQGRTPLFIAATHGHAKAVACFLEKGADPALVSSSEGKSPLCIAVFYGHIEVVKVFLSNPFCALLLELADGDGKMPLHTAMWMDPKKEIVRLLLQAGANPHAQSKKFLFTPLHWAAKHGHIESARLLLSYQARVDVRNKNGDNPLDLAFRHSQDDIVHLFLGTSERLRNLPEINKDDQEGAYYRCLLQAKREGLIEEQILYLEKMSTFFMDKQDFFRAAQNLNCALALAKGRPILERYFYNKLERIEGLFLEKYDIKTAASERDYLQKERMFLKNLRNNIANSALKDQPIDKILKQLTLDFRNLLKHLINSAQKRVGDPPTAYAWIGMGSMARLEMSLFSDLEFACLIHIPPKTPKNTIREYKRYFRHVAQLLKIKIVNFGETPFEIFREEAPSPTLKGFRLDSGGNTPLGNESTYRLIGSPQEIAQLQIGEKIEEQLIVSNALRTFCFLDGEKSLVEDYAAEVFKLLGKRQTLFGQSNRQIFALELLKGALQEFSPDLSAMKQEMQAFGIKAELYRPLQEWINCLTLFYGIRANTTLKRIDLLKKKNIFNETGAENLKTIFKEVLKLRLEAHQFYQQEKDVLCHRRKGEEDGAYWYFDDQKVELVTKIYETLVPLFNQLKKFCLKQDKSLLNESFFSENLVNKFKEPYQWDLERALTVSEQALSLNPYDVYVLTDAASLNIQLGKVEKAMEQLNKAFEVATSKQNSLLWKVHQTFGDLFLSCGRYEKAWESYQTAFDQIPDKEEGEDQVDIALQLAEASLKMNQLDEAWRQYSRLLELILECDPKEIRLVKVYTRMAMIMQKLGQDERTQEYFELANNLAEKLQYTHNFRTREIVSDYFEHALYYYRTKLDSQKALHLFRFGLIGQSHREPRISRMRYTVGILCQELTYYQEALVHLKQAFREISVLYGPLHPNLAIIHTNMAQIYSAMDASNQASEHIKQGQEVLYQISLLKDPLFHGLIQDIKEEDISSALLLLEMRPHLLELEGDLSKFRSEKEKL